MTSGPHYVYGVVPAGTRLPDDVQGVAAGRPVLLESGDLALLVSPVDDELELETRDNVLAHARVLDSVVLSAPVLPLRYGTVVDEPAEAVKEILDANGDEFTGMLEKLDGTAEFTLSATYVEESVLGDVAARNEAVRELAEATRGKPVEESRDERIRLGELVVKELSGMREGDAADLVEELEPVVREMVTHEPGTPTVVLDAALLVDLDAWERMDQAVEKAAERHAGRIHMRLVGPRAPYDFVPEE